MRALAAMALALTLLSGCLSDDGKDDDAAAVAPPLTVEDIEIPGQAALEAIEGGFAAVWKAAVLPFSTDVKVPEHATMMRAVAMDSAATSVTMSNLETGRRRCNNPTVESFSEPFQAPRSCSGVT